MAELVYATGSNPVVEKHVGSNPTRIIRKTHTATLTFVSIQVQILSQARIAYVAKWKRQLSQKQCNLQLCVLIRLGSSVGRALD